MNVVQLCNFFKNVLKNLTKETQISYIKTMFIKEQLGNKTPGSRSPTLVHTIVIGNPRDFCKRCMFAFIRGAVPLKFNILWRKITEILQTIRFHT